MITVHHLNHSRSHRVLWMLEELELLYEFAASAEAGVRPGGQRADAVLHQAGSPCHRQRRAQGVHRSSTEDASGLYGSGAGQPRFAGDSFSAADVQMSVPLEAARSRAGLDQSLPRLLDFLERIQQRPAYQRAVERG